MAGIMQMMLAGGPGVFVFRQTITANTLSYNLRNAAIAAGWDGVSPLDALVTLNSGIVIGATNTSAYAFDTGTGFPVGSTLGLTINSGGYIVGAGGRGHDYNTGGYAKSGGPALRAQFALTVTNNGTIGGGGGGGDRGNQYLQDQFFLAGGGGAGYPAGAGGAGRGPVAPPTTDFGSHPAYDGTLTAGGAGQYMYLYYEGEGGGYVGPADGAGGGSLGQAGAAMKSNNSDPGAGGAAVTGNSFITWIATGTRLGAVS